MARPAPTWNVLPHRPIQKLTENLWTVTGALPNMPLDRVLSIAKMGDGRLVLHNGIALEEPAMKEIEAFGKPSFLLVPNGYHRMDAPAFKQRYPEIKVLCPEGARKKVEEVVAVDGTYADLPADDRVSLHDIEGVGRGEGYLKVRSDDGVTLVFNDVFFNMPHKPGLQGLVLRLMGSTGGPKVTRVGKLFLIKDKQAVKAQLEALASTPDLRRVIVMHGDSVSDDPGGLLRKVAATLS